MQDASKGSEESYTNYKIQKKKEEWWDLSGD